MGHVCWSSFCILRESSVKTVIQRVKQASVWITHREVAKIGQGLLILVGIENSDTEKDVEWMAEKCIHLRIFENENGKMDNSVLDRDGEILIVSQFTLLGDCRKGRRPDFTQAAPIEKAKMLYEKFVEEIRKRGIRTETGIFQAQMEVHLVNDGPVTLILDSKKEAKS